tara:strand:+ start:5306 stop:5647 length:342 start_codon:yes stop_codon:yes gene_type:complete
MSSVSSTNNNPTEEVTMSTATNIQQRYFGAVQDPIKLNGAYAEYINSDDLFCRWEYQRATDEWSVKMCREGAWYQITRTNTLSVAVAAWNVYCDAVDGSQFIMDDELPGIGIS